MQANNARTLIYKKRYTYCYHTKHSKQGHSHHQYPSESHSFTPYKKRPRRETRSMTIQALKSSLYQVRESLLC
jgi:hypothetical protein